MQHKTVIVHAFDQEDFFIRELAHAYAATQAEAGAVVETLAVNNLQFAHVLNPKEYNYQGLEADLQHCIDAIKSANSLVFFLNYRPDMNPAFTQFLSRIFHLKAGVVNPDIWGKERVHDRKVRILSVIDDEPVWEAFKLKKDPALLPTSKVNFRLFGFGFLASATFGFLRDDVMNDYGRKQLEKVKKYALDDLVDPIDDLLNS